MGRLPVVPDLGAYLREQRIAARLSLRELADRAGMSNPYLSQVERGLRKPSAEILGALADALDLSAEALYVRAGILDAPSRGGDVVAAVAADPHLTDAQKRSLVDLYRLFVGDRAAGGAVGTTAGGHTDAPLHDSPPQASTATPAGARPVGGPDDGITPPEPGDDHRGDLPQRPSNVITLPTSGTRSSDDPTDPSNDPSNDPSHSEENP